MEGVSHFFGHFYPNYIIFVKNKSPFSQELIQKNRKAEKIAYAPCRLWTCRPPLAITLSLTLKLKKRVTGYFWNNALEWESRFTLGLNATKVPIKQNLSKIKFPIKTYMDAYLYLP